MSGRAALLVEPPELPGYQPAGVQRVEVRAGESATLAVQLERASR